MAINADELEIQALSMRFVNAGYLAPDWPTFTRKDVLAMVGRVGIKAVDYALARYIGAAGENLTPKRFGNELGDWLRTVPQAMRECRQGHTFQGALVAHDDLPTGALMRARVCGWCGHKEPAHGTPEASIEPATACGHKRTETCTGPLAERAGTVGQVMCLDCGQVVAGVAA